MKRADFVFNVARLPVDFFMLFLAGLATYLFRVKLISAFRPVLFEFNLPLIEYLYLVLLVSFVFIGAYAVSGLYSLKARIGYAEEFLKISVASSAGIMIVIIYIFLRQELFDSRFLVLGAWLLAIIFVFLGRLLIRNFQKFFVSGFGFGIHKAVIIGGDNLSRQIDSAISSTPSLGYKILSRLEHPDMEKISLIFKQDGIDEIILAMPDYPADDIVELVDFCHINHVVFKFVPNLHQTLTSNFDIDTVDGVPLIELKRTRLDGWGKVAKRLVDFAGSVAGLTIFSPIFLALPFLIKLETEGPVFVKLKRISKNREFSLYKFRSMVKNAEELKQDLIGMNERSDGPLFKIKNDPRITKVGRVIRKYRIDEIPQFINILKGEISLVGPRPHQPDEVGRYQKHHKKVLAIKAGATGLAQVSGSSDLPFEQEVALDSFYIENWSLLLDLKILLRTIFKVLNDRSAV